MEDIKQPKEEKPAVEFKYAEPMPDPAVDPLIDDQFGLIPTITAAPTFTPRKFSEQIRITDGQVHIYDTENQAWISLGVETTHGGLVNSNGTAGTPFPTGWSVETTGTGFYVVTHNLGHSNYAVVAHAYSTSVRAVNLSSVGSTSFTVNTKTSAGADVDNAFYFILKDMS